MIIHKGCGIVNSLINSLPFELHIPKYQYCGPGTALSKRLARGDPGINPLDKACKEHDIAYAQNRERGEARTKADKILAGKAWERVKAKDSSFGEKAAALLVTGTMKLKTKMGMGVRNKKKKKTTKAVKKKKPSIQIENIIDAASKGPIRDGNTSKAVIKTALEAARMAVKKAGGKSKVTVPSILPLTKRVGGALPFLIPLFARLSATGALAGGAAGIAKAVNDVRTAREALIEKKRHNNAHGIHCCG